MELKRKGSGEVTLKLEQKVSKIGGQVFCQEVEWTAFPSRDDPLDIFEEVRVGPSSTKMIVPPMRAVIKPKAEGQSGIVEKMKTRWINRYYTETKELPTLVAACEIETQE